MTVFQNHLIDFKKSSVAERSFGHCCKLEGFFIKMEPSSPPGMYFNVLAFFFVLSLVEIKMPSCLLRSEKKIAARLSKES